MTRLGLIGCGQIAQSVHLPALARAPGLRLVALADPDAARLERATARAPGVAAYGTAAALLADASVDAVLIASPPATHAALAVAAFEAGKHVYLEKPVATSVEDGDRVRAAWCGAGTVGMVGFNYRFGALQQEAREQLLDGRVGPLVGARTVFSAARRSLPGWKQGRASGGGALLDLASHHIDLVRFLFDAEVAEVSAHVWSGASEHDGAMVRLGLTTGLPVQMFVSLSAVDEDRIEVYGQSGKLAFDRHTSAAVEVSPPAFSYGRLPQVRRLGQALGRAVQSAWRRPGEPSFERALGAFAAAIRDGRPAAPSLDDGCQSLRVVVAAEAAARTGGTVTLGPSGAAALPPRSTPITAAR